VIDMVFIVMVLVSVISSFLFFLINMDIRVSLRVS
jgi:hypothetical protein